MTSRHPITIRFTNSGTPAIQVHCTAEGAARLAALLRSVPAAGSLHLGDVPDVEFDGLTSFAWSTELRPFLRRLRDKTPAFEWGGDAEAWESRAQLLEHLHEPGHLQYLNYESIGDAEMSVEVVTT